MRLSVIVAATIFILVGIWAIIRADYAMAGFWIAIAGVFLSMLVVLDVDASEPQQMKKALTRMIPTIIAATVAAALLGYQVGKDLANKYKSDRNSASDRIDRRHE